MYDEGKYREFNRMLKETNAEVVIIPHPETLGDNYEEMVENLNRIADSDKRLAIVPRSQRK